MYAQSALVIVTSHSASSGTQSWAQTLENNNNGIFTMVMFQMDNAGNVYVGYTSQTTGAITVSALSEQVHSRACCLCPRALFLLLLTSVFFLTCWFT